MNPSEKRKGLIPTRFKYYHLANDVLLGNLIANFAGSVMVDAFIYYRAPVYFDKTISFFQSVDDVVTVIWVLCSIVTIIFYERPIRRCLKSYYNGDTPDSALLAQAKKRVLNEPLFIVGFNSITWILISVFYWFLGAPGSLVVGVSNGLITVVLAFFWVEHVIQNNLIPLFFPDGGLSKVPGVVSVSLRTRLGALIFAVSIVPLTYIHLTISRFRTLQANGQMSETDLLRLLQEAVSIQSLVFIGLGIFLSLMVSQTLRKPVEEIILSLSRVVKGDFAAKTRIYARDEIGFAGETLNIMAEGLKEKEFIRRTFGRYVGETVRDEILKGEIPMDGELKQATILFADLRNFTPLVEKTPPSDMVKMLNAYLDEMTQCIRRNKGLVLQFIGDEIEAVFGAPVSMPGHEQNAVEAALEMRHRLELLNASLSKKGYPALNHGIGIHTGQVLAANIGTKERTAYSLIGDTVNTASRIQGMNKVFKTDILVSHAIYEKTKSGFSFVQMPRVELKGKSVAVDIYSLP